MNRPLDPHPSTLATADAAHEAPDRAGSGVRVGELDAGAIGVVWRGGVIEHVVPAPSGSRSSTTTVSWWIGAEDRWHRPAEEPTTRDRLLGGCPVVETVIRVPSGETIGRSTVARVQGVDRPSYIFDVENASPIPVVFAYVVTSTESMTLDVDGVTVAGVGRLTLTRPAMGFASAASIGGLLEIVESGDLAASPPSVTTATPPGAVGPGAVAVLVPLPHTAHAVATFTPTDEPGDLPTAALGDRTLVPTPDQVVAGWAAHVASGPSLDVADERRRSLFDAAVCDLLMGPADPATPGNESPETVAAVATALGRLGRVDSSDLLWSLVDAQRANGSVRAVDTLGATAGLLRACGAWWDGGGDEGVADDLVGPVAKAAHWLGRRRQASAIAGREHEVVDALRSVTGLLVGVDQPDVLAAARHLADRLEAAAGGSDARTSRRSEGADDGGTSTVTSMVTAMVTRLADARSWPDPSGRPDPAASAAFVVASLDELVATVAGPDDVVAPDSLGTLALAGAWSPTLAGVPIEAHDVPTRWGLVSFGVRWHGDRPALLWEVSPMPGRTGGRSTGRTAGRPTITTPSLDPSWSTTELRGEALLQALPDAPEADHDTATPQPPEGGTFS